MRINGRLVGGGLTFLLLLFLLGSVVNQVVDAPPAAAAGCTKGQTHEYVKDAAPGSNQFGPPITDLSLKAGTDRYKLKTCTSPFFAAVTVAYVDNKLNMDASKIAPMAQRFHENRAEWQKALDTVESKTASWSVEDDTSTYHTLAATPQENGWPVLTKASRSIPVGRVLVQHLKDGSERKYRYGCDLQPVEEDFPKVPDISSVPTTTPPATTPPVPTSAPPRTTPSTGPPRTTPTTVTVVCEDDEERFEDRCVKKAGQRVITPQPVAEHPQVATPGATVFGATPPAATRPQGDVNGGSGSGGARPADPALTDNSDARQVFPPAAVGGPARCNPAVQICP